jgi:hypothetical protein
MQAILDLHPKVFTECKGQELVLFEEDYHELDRIFGRDSEIVKLNRFVSCEGWKTATPENDKEPEWVKQIRVPGSGDWYADWMADLTSSLGGFEQAQTIAATLTQSQIDAFRYRSYELSIPRERRLKLEQQRWFEEEFMQDQENADWLAEELFAGAT